MNQILAKVSEIQKNDSLHIVKFEFNSLVLSMMSLEIDEDIKVGTKVKLLVKPSHVAIAKDFSGELSYSNKLDATITSIENGQLLSSLKLNCFDTVLESIITFNSSKNMNLKIGDRVTALIKASELSIGEVLDD